MSQERGALNRLYSSKTNPPKPKRPQLSQLHTVDEIRRWLPDLEREIHTTLAQTTSVRYTDDKVDAMYKRISDLEKEHKNFRRKIAQLELGPDVNVLTRTIPSEKQIDVYTKKCTHQPQSLEEFFDKPLELPLLARDDYQVVTTMKPREKKSLVDYSDSD